MIFVLCIIGGLVGGALVLLAVRFAEAQADRVRPLVLVLLRGRGRMGRTDWEEV